MKVNGKDDIPYINGKIENSWFQSPPIRIILGESLPIPSDTLWRLRGNHRGMASIARSNFFYPMIFLEVSIQS